ncbi:MAG: nitrate/nitrite transporter NrtS [Spongiibacteraceae bacterium]
MKHFGQILIKRRIVINALRVALVVGTLLNIINQGGQLLSGVDIVWGQVLLNFFVPYCVASYSAAKNEIDRKE